MRRSLLLNFFLFLCSCFYFSLSSLNAEEKKEGIPLLANRALVLSAHGQVSYTFSEGPIDGFLLRRMRFALDGDILHNLRWRVQLEMVKSPFVLDGYMDWKFLSHLTLRVGQFKVPFSLENLTSTYAMDTINRSLTVERLCPGRDILARGRDIGATVSGAFSKFDFVIGVFNGAGINTLDNNKDKDFSARFVFHPTSSLRLGASYYKGQYTRLLDALELDRERIGLDLHFVMSRFSLKVESIFADDNGVDKYGWYAQAGYFFKPEKIQAIVRLDSSDEDETVAGGRRDILIVGLNWFFGGKTKLQVNYEWRNVETREETPNVLIVQLQVGF